MDSILLPSCDVSCTGRTSLGDIVSEIRPQPQQTIEGGMEHSANIHKHERFPTKQQQSKTADTRALMPRHFGCSEEAAFGLSLTITPRRFVQDW